MQKRKFLVAVLAVFFGVSIFISSLVVSSQQDLASADKVSRKQFYFGKKVLPDHILYPVLMVIDKSLLVMTSGESEIFLRIRLAQDRMISANSLLDKKEEGLSLSTLTKSQKYLILATQEFLSLPSPSDDVGTGLLLALEENTANIKKIQTRFQKIDTAPLSELIIESETLIVAVQNKIRE